LGPRYFEALLDKDERVMAVFAPPDAPGGSIDQLKEVASAKGIPIY